ARSSRLNSGAAPGSQPVQRPVSRAGSMNTLPKRLIAAPLSLLRAGALALAVPVALVLPATPAAAQADRLDEVVGALRAISTLKADFVQTDRSGQSARGELTIKRPGRILFEYERGDLRIVANGSRLTMVDYEVNQVESWPIGNTPLAALFDPSRDVKRYGRLLPTSNPNVVSVEVKDAKKPELGTITLI